ncbi:anthranilate synthase component I family protein [Numidum massiliense]|uniref:anthranilate synthase component I family protein n=1 Tax=Numidum massiliense TaxID=1522315 RepID=UPI0006D54D19|nr:chorismate-binding protein [Numidum massiliense]
MIHPQVSEVVHLARTYNAIPICRTVLADTETPIGLFQKVKRSRYAFLLESVERGEKWGRYSFIGSEPFLVFKAKDSRVTVRTAAGASASTHQTDRTRTAVGAAGRTNEVNRAAEQTVLCTDPIGELERIVEQYRSPEYEGYPPFLGGAIGALSYEALCYAKNIPVPAADPLAVPDVHVMLCRRMLAFDHLTNHVIAMQLLHVPPAADDARMAQLYEETVSELVAWSDGVLQSQRRGAHAFPSGRAAQTSVQAPLSYRSNVTKQTFMDNVVRAKQHIARGEAGQIVLSQRLEAAVEAAPFDVYRVLRTINPSPYMYFLALDEETVVGASPESLVKVSGGVVETRPIAGTRKRAADRDEDERLARELLQDAKELAEHAMLVDLGKGDLSRVCDAETVEVTQSMAVERYSHVMHLVSRVSGRLKSDLGPFAALTACIPAGTVSGAPRERAMQIIADIEGERRGIYSGGIGYLAFSGNIDLCIAIRTIVFKHGKAYIQAGSGIVAGSVPENEYEESLNKARALLAALAQAEQMYQREKV